MEERVDHLCLQLRTDPPNHTEVEERKMPAVHYQQVSRVRVGVEKTVIQQLLEIRADQQTVNFDWRNAIRSQAFEVNHLRATNEIERKYPRICVGPVDLRNSNGTPGAKVVTKPVRITSLFHVVRLFKDGGVKLAQHSFPICILIRAREETIRQLHEAEENRHIEGNDRLQIRTLHLNGDFLPRCQSCPVDLSEGSGGNRLAIDLCIAFVKTATQFRLDDRECFRSRECRHLILQCRELVHILERQQIRARPKLLTDLDKGRSKTDQRLSQPNRLLYEPGLLLRGTFGTAKHEVAQHADDAVQGGVEFLF